MKLNLKPWNKDLQKVDVTATSLEDLLKIVDRDIKDCQIELLSDDRRFATGYGAALNLTSYAIRKQGYRVSGKVGHHKITFDVAGEILGPDSVRYIQFFDLCRRKRNKVDYDLANVVTKTEVYELIDMVNKFKHFVISNT